MWQSESVKNTICKSNSKYDSRAVVFPEVKSGHLQYRGK